MNRSLAARRGGGELLAWDWPEPDKLAFPFAQLGRPTADRSRDLDDATQPDR